MLSVFATGYHKGQPYVSDPKVKSFIQWTKTLKDNVVLQKTAVGGHYCYPRPPLKCTQSMSDPSGERKTQSGSFYFFKNTLTGLDFRMDLFQNAPITCRRRCIFYDFRA